MSKPKLLNKSSRRANPLLSVSEKRQESDQLSLLDDYDKLTLDFPYVVNSSDKTDNLISWMKKNPTLAFDIETDSLSYLDQGLSLFAFSNAHEGFAIPVSHKRISCISNEDLKRILDAFFTHCNRVIGHNLQFDLKCLVSLYHIFTDLPYTDIIDKLPKFFDTYWAAFVLEQERFGGNGLKNCVKTILNKTPTTFDEVTKDYHSIYSSDPEKLALYCIDDCTNSFQLAKIFSKRLEQEKLSSVFFKIKMPLERVLLSMEIYGIKIDYDLLNTDATVIKKAIQSTKDKITEIDPKFTATIKSGKCLLDSPKELGIYLFSPKQVGGLNLPIKLPRTASGAYDVTEYHLSLIRNHHSAIPLILEYRKLYKVYSTFVESLYKFISSDNRIHPTWKGVGVRTGRLAGKEPNMMNFPSKDTIIDVEGSKHKINPRSFFIPDENCLFFNADYKQLELRLLTHLTEEKVFLDSFGKDLDPHVMIAGMVELLDHPELVSKLGHLYEDTSDPKLQEKRESLYKAKNIMDNLEAELGPEEAKRKALEPVFGENYKLYWDIIKPERNKAKTIVYGILYGATASRISKELNISIDKAQALIDRFNEKLVNIGSYTEATHKFIEDYGYMRTYLGTIRKFPSYNNIDKLDDCLRAGFNFNMQGLGAEIIAAAMVRIHNNNRLRKTGSRIVLQVHDELINSIPVNWQEIDPEIPYIMKEIMEDPFHGTVDFKVPLEVDWSIETRWTK